MKTADNRVEMPDYPERAVMEGIVNALIHRDYLQLGSEVHIDMYDDRLEIFSPGGMIDGTKVQELDPMNVSSMRRNPVIADIFGRLNYMDRRGSGFKKILSNYQFQPQYTDKMAPSFNSDNNRFVLRMDNLNYKDKIIIEETGKKTGKKTVEIILEIMKENPKVTVGEIANTIGISVSGVQYHVEKLKNEKRIERVGPDNGGHWVVRKQ